MIGMTGETITRLMAAEPVLLNMHNPRFGVPDMQVMLVAARDELTIMHQLRSSGLMPPCCRRHARTCVAPDQRCCRECSEATHPDHPLGVRCVAAETADEAANIPQGT